MRHEIPPSSSISGTVPGVPIPNSTFVQRVSMVAQRNAMNAVVRRDLSVQPGQFDRGDIDSENVPMGESRLRSRENSDHERPD